MSVLSQQPRELVSEPAGAEEESLVFAAASIIREMTSQPMGRPVREVISNGGRFRLEGRRLKTELDQTGPIVLVFVQPAEQVFPNDEELRRRFGLTRKESWVARLIAEDQTNEQIAVELSISPHTARHHTERVLAKLGAKSRTRVRSALLS